ncbi:MAG: hypothetical protein OXC92_03495 [Flavobacteriaceae bacterium]|nr:hypothetical protein [Flavobacteriaceae bacterium]
MEPKADRGGHGHTPMDEGIGRWSPNHRIPMGATAIDFTVLAARC